MISKFALLGTLLLSSSALADHPSQPGAPFVRRDENPQSQSLGRVDSRTLGSDTHWNLATSGSQLSGERFKYITAAVALPSLTGKDGMVLISMGLDTACEYGSLRIGIQGNITGGAVSWNASGQWLPNPSVDLNVTMTTGDVMALTVLAGSLTTGAVVLENESTNQVISAEFNTTNPLCMNSAGWYVNVVMDQDARMQPLANFSTISFTNAMALTNESDSQVTYLPFGTSQYTVFGIAQENKYLVNTSGNGSTLIVSMLE